MSSILDTMMVLRTSARELTTVDDSQTATGQNCTVDDPVNPDPVWSTYSLSICDMQPCVILKQDVIAAMSRREKARLQRSRYSQ
ncbi:hypothetical protein KIN20_027400 [Parelaphostrongylus tenuis]|uniref:Uncharacterized protein n=1 Tax=Parelaphostrongylus tenuis TaxID=148309 RepID=A0AAD5WDR6_PARTN|nr:hypothetical protein KIN20_027400 [Parelaphostrongylus tenuis]